MKFTKQVLALCLLQGAAAFMAPSPVTIGQTSLNAFSYLGEDADAGKKTTDNVPGAGPSVTAGSLKKNSSGAQPASTASVKNIWDTSSPVTVQGGSLRTWSFTDPSVERVQVLMRTEGRPLNADIDLWQGPDNTPQKMRVYIEDGNERPFSAVVETPRAGQNSIAIRNTGELEFPLSAVVEDGSESLDDSSQRLSEMSIPETIQGGALKTYSFAPSVASVQVLLKTDGRPLNARIELLQGPNNDKQIIQLYTEDGMERPFYVVIETPGVGNVVRCVNTAPVEFPLTACVEPFVVDPGTEGSSGRDWETGGTGGTSFFVSGGR